MLPGREYATQRPQLDVCMFLRSLKLCSSVTPIWRVSHRNIKISKEIKGLGCNFPDTLQYNTNKNDDDQTISFSVASPPSDMSETRLPDRTSPTTYLYLYPLSNTRPYLPFSLQAAHKHVTITNKIAMTGWHFGSFTSTYHLVSRNIKCFIQE